MVPETSSYVRTPDNKEHKVVRVGIVIVALHNGGSVNQIPLRALHVPSLGQTLVSMTCLNIRGKIGFNLSEEGVPSLTKSGARWADIRRTSNGLLRFPGSILWVSVKRA